MNVNTYFNLRVAGLIIAMVGCVALGVAGLSSCLKEDKPEQNDTAIITGAVTDVIGSIAEAKRAEAEARKAEACAKSGQCSNE